MKTIITTLAILLAATFAHGQSCAPPSCSREIMLNFSYSASTMNAINNYSGSRVTTCFDGNGSLNVVPPNMNLNGVTNFVFKSNAARYDVRQMLDFRRIYVNTGADVSLNLFSADGGDTVFVSGNLDIASVQNVNNSTTGNRMVIVLVGSGTVRIQGQQYLAGSTFQAPGNATNQIDIIAGCNQTLPITFETFKVKSLGGDQYEVTFSLSETEVFDRYEVRFSFDGKTYKTGAIIFPDDLKLNTLYTVKITAK